MKTQKLYLFFAILFVTASSLYSQGSRVLAPNYAGTASLVAPGTANDDFAWLEHDVFGNVDFLDPDAPTDEKLYVYLRQGETLRYGIRRIPVKQSAGTAYSSSTTVFTNQDLTIFIYDTLNNSIAQATHFDANTASDGDATLTTTNGSGSDGIITTVASSLLGPEFTFNSTTYNSGGYTPREYTNNTGSDQAFYIAFLQDNYTFTSEAQLITDINGGTINDADVRSWYDLWDFTVYDGSLEKTGRLFCRRWIFTAQYFDNLLADELELFVRVPSTVGGAAAGNYIKRVDLGGLDPLSLAVYANSVGSDGSGGDLNGDGVTDFQDNRQSQLNDIATEEYDIFLENPDIDIFPTTTLPTITITEAQFYCNATGTGGEAIITFDANQVGYVAILIDLDGTTGYQAGTEDVIIEGEITTEGALTIQWDGLDGLGAAVPSGTNISISGRFTAGPIHVPMFDVEESESGITMLDVRPSTSFDLIYWDDSYLAAQGQNTGANPTSELDGTNLSPHLWNETGGNNGGESNLVNTWSFGYYQINTQNVTFTFTCDNDGDGVSGSADLDSDNDGLTNAQEGDPFTDTDADGIFDYLDSDVAGYVDSNADGVNDNFDQDQDGVIDAFDLDSDNDGVPDLVELLQNDTDNDGQVDGFTDVSGGTFQYLQSTSCSTTFETISSPTTGPTTDDGSVNPSLPFDFEFFNTNFTSGTTTTLNANAWFSLDNINPGTPWTAVTTPNATFTNTIFLNHRDHTPNTGGTVTYGTNGSAPNRIFLVEFNAVPFFTGTGTQTVQLQLHETTNEIRILTSNFSPGTLQNATMGLNVDGTTSLAVTGRNAAQYTITTAECRSFTPFSGNGIDDTIDGSPLTVTNTDGDGVGDHLDLDSDNDGIVDVIEFGGTGDAATGQISGFTDSNDNGWNDAQESVALSRPNTDGDGTLLDYRDIDTDNDGIIDNVEAQSSASYIASNTADTDSDGLYDVYDPNNGGTFLDPVDTDSDGTEDYQSADADGDGVDDIIEGFDADRDGFGDWDSNSNNILETADFSGFDSDGDSDGLWNVFDTDNSGTTAPTQNSDGAGNSDWQDTDDDNDGILTSGEDTNTNDDWTDDKTQGQGGSATVPDYLYRGDYDGDAIADASDADSDNDGILDVDEDGGESVDPSGDEDGDGIPNYRDASDTDVTDNIVEVDNNGDGVWDNYDSDLDGVPDFLDLDSDNDGIWDAVEADGGSVPFGLDTNTGQFTLQDPDNDGIMNFVDTDDVSAGGSSDLANPDTDADGVNDFLDIDSDADGIPDIIEAQTTASLLTLSNSDSDGDGIDDTFDPGSGGTLITPVNSDGVDLQDYLDTDSDNDNVPDVIEGDDGDFNGVTDVTVTTTDTDGDGLVDPFDTVDLTVTSTGNSEGSNVDLQNTDGIDFKDWRDSNDDNDSALTEDEDANSNGDYSDDQTNGQSGAIPDYLFNGDKDNDGLADASDADSDNDGILDTDEDGGESVNPSLDADNDGIPNYRDADIAGSLSASTDSNSDGIFDVFDQDLDGLPDFLDSDSDNDGVPDVVEAGGADTDSNGLVDGLNDDDNDGLPNNVDVSSTGGIDSDGDGIDDAFDFSVSGGTDTDGDDIIDSADLDIDGDGLANTYDTDDGGTALTPSDADGDGLADVYDLDSDNDGITDLKEYGGTDSDGDGKLDDLTDSDSDGFADLIDSDNGGTALPRPDSDNDLVLDYLDVDSDNDGVPDPVDNGGPDTNNDGRVDGFSSDSDGDGLADVVDPDSGGTPISNSDVDGDGLGDYQDLDADNDGYPDILEAGGTDSDNDGIVNNTLDSDDDGIPDNVDVNSSGTNGGSGSDSDGDQIDDTFDVDETGGADTDGDSIDDTFDTDRDGDGLDDNAEANPYGQEDKEGDGNKDFRDLDSDGDGIVDVIEFNQTVNTANGQISGFDDSSNNNGWNDATESSPFSPVNSDSDSFADYQDIDSDDDGLPDLIEAQTKATFIAISDTDTDDDGLDDAFDPDNGGTIITPVNTDATGNEDYLDTDSDGDTVPDNVEGANDDKSQYADWDTDTDNDPTDETGYTTDSDSDGLRDLFDNVASSTSANVTGSNSDGQDSDVDGTWDFQDTDDDNDGILTSAEDTQVVDGDPTNDFAAGGTPIPDYLFGDPDSDGDGVSDTADLDSDNDGLADTNEDGGTGIDPSGDVDSDGLLNYQDSDIDGDGTANSADTNGDGSGTNTTAFVDSNGDGTIDQFDKDLDGIPNFLDLDSDNDGIVDLLELGLTDADQDGTLSESASLADNNANGLADPHDPNCDGSSTTVNVVTATGNGGVSNATSAQGTDDDVVATVTDAGILTLDFGATIVQGSTVSFNLYKSAGGQDPTYTISYSPDNVSYTNSTINGTTLNVTTTTNTVNITLTATDARYVRISKDNTANRDVAVDFAASTYVPCSGGVAVSGTDTDSDGIDDHLDIDADNDGIVDNVEAQTTGSYIAPTAGDTDSNGILDIYDPNNGGTYISPENTDGTDNDDYLDTDSDNDNVADNIEAFDANSDGFAAWDTDGDNDITDEGGSGYNVDSDNDGLWLIFDNSSGLGTIANITGSNNNRQDTDGDNIEDWRDVDDDEDGTNTSGEDNNTNSNFADDFTQGGGSTPDYLYDPDVDGDNILDQNDGDSDNDGVLNTDEYAGAVYASSGTPFDDADGDGIYNYLDDNDVNNTSYVDVNGDNVDDQVDQDRDGIPNFFDLDSDNDGILDAIEANNGVVPSIGSFSSSTGRFSGTDGNLDGIVDAVASAPLTKSDFDSDGLDDYLDLDTDNDGITDNVEAQSTSGRVNPADADTDGDGWDDSYDPDNGGASITPVNTDSGFTIADTEPDYRDVDADNDNDGIGFVGDEIEGFDANRNGFSELDSDLDLDLSDESGHNTDTDSDGLWDLYDNFSGRGVNNINGSRANLQDTDGDGILDFRDQDDDEDNISTAVEDVDSDGNWTNDKIQGGGATPDYLFFNDSDNDRIADGQDSDGDNDGILDSDEYDNTTYRDPFGDQDGDGVFNYNDADNPNTIGDTQPLTDSNGDGIWDEYDTDLDGVPNFFDLDSDNDGIQDILEAGGTDSDNDGKLDGTTDSDDDGIFDNVDVDSAPGNGGSGVDTDGDDIDDTYDTGQLTDTDMDGVPDYVDVDSAPGNGGSGVDTDGDDIDDTFDATQTGGTDLDGDSIDDATDLDDDGDSILDTADLDDDGDGIVNTIDADEGGTPLADGDFDGDGLVNRIDIDSDSDGLVDLIEAGGSDTDGDGMLDTTGDTDGDGWGNLVDSDNGGTALTVPNTDGTDEADYLDIDADDDGIYDFNEGFDDDEDGSYTDDYTDRATAFGNATFYDPLDLSWYSTDSDTDNLPNFLDPDNSEYADADSDGLINLFDTDQGGNFYGNVSGKPDNDGDTEENYVDRDGNFTLTPTVITTGENGTNSSFDVVLTLQPATNVVINISESSDEISLATSQLTFTNANWNVAQTVGVNGEDDSDNDGDVAYQITVSVSDANSDDDFDTAPDQQVFGTNLDNEGSIRVSTSTATTGEDGTNSSFDVELSVAPTTNVVIDVSESSDEGSISPTQLTFTNANWNTPQTVNITHADDNLLDGDQNYNITLSVNDPLSDNNFDDAVDETVTVTNVDDDEGVVLSTTSVVTSESGSTANFTVVLDVQPTSNVIIDLSEVSDEGSVSPTQLTFTNGNYNVAQLVTVTPADDIDQDGDQVYGITVSVNASSDAAFLGVADQTVFVTNQDDENPLPLDFLSFTGHVEDGGVRLEWATTNEVNVETIFLQKSYDGEIFTDLFSVPGTNVEDQTNYYQYLDSSPTEGLNYYRLRQVDFDGTEDLSELVIVQWTTEVNELEFYPNPVQDVLNVRGTSVLGQISYQIFDLRGTTTLSGSKISRDTGTQLDVSALKPGVYLLVVKVGADTQRTRIIKR